MHPLNRGVLLKQVWFTVNMRKQIQNFGQRLLSTKFTVSHGINPFNYFWLFKVVENNYHDCNKFVVLSLCAAQVHAVMQHSKFDKLLQNHSSVSSALTFGILSHTAAGIFVLYPVVLAPWLSGDAQASPTYHLFLCLISPVHRMLGCLVLLKERIDSVTGVLPMR